MTEQDMNRCLGDFFRGAGADFARVENGIASGMPDINICYMGMEVWVESKLCLGTRGVLLRKEQYAWGMRRARAGGSVFCVARDNADERWLVWKFPELSIIIVAGNKYVRIDSEPQSVEMLSQVKKILFPSV